MAIKLKASANTSAKTIAVKIFGALEGFLPNALMLAKDEAANTAQGPKMAKPKIINSARLRPMV